MKDFSGLLVVRILLGIPEACARSMVLRIPCTELFLRQLSILDPSTCFHDGTRERFASKPRRFPNSHWHQELALRTALLYCGNLISNAFGSVSRMLLTFRCLLTVRSTAYGRRSPLQDGRQAGYTCVEMVRVSNSGI